MGNTVSLRLCNFCGQETERQVLYVKKGYSILKCLRCSLVYVNEHPSRAELDTIYSEDFFNIGVKFSGDAVSTTLNNAQQRVTHLIDTVHPGVEKWLDVGCATGDFLRMARPYVKEVHGIEISQYAINQMKKRGIQNVTAGDFLEIRLPSDEFDVVTMWDVLEHVCDPMSNLQKTFRILKSGGYFVFSTGDIKSLMARLTGRYWHLMIPPRHLYFFSRTTIRTMLLSTGFAVLDIQYPGKRVPLDFMLWKFSRLTVPGLNNIVLRWMTKLKLGRLAPFVNFRDIMTIYARKPER